MVTSRRTLLFDQLKQRVACNQLKPVFEIALIELPDKTILLEKMIDDPFCEEELLFALDFFQR
ncbi:MAG: hypothetical protein P8Y12_06140, partial [Gammaproteobacteria bacterium]